ncbi:hypothetical protein [Massilia cavernae]|uniref:Core-binding (CB) domain-containing protein n=1 Tax=Massilia cavernae TaxID=2320864 RepID=A0A418XDR0_9BURK|nr:hypothetical protein [Massilia cavernae]RJG10682.1 hypothetical protein D3872_21840 [Massilia cavernae]
MDFADWLVAKKLSPSTVKKYVGAIGGALTSWANENQITSKSLREITDRDEFESIAELIGDTEVFTTRNRRGNNMYGAALNNYSTFLAREQDPVSHSAQNSGSFFNPLSETEDAEAAAPPFEP